jgi:hypothetical protein
MTKKLWEIAEEISADGWIHHPGAVHAQPYWNAMRDLETITDTYGADSAKSIVLYFLANAGTWRGETARRIKQELRGDGEMSIRAKDFLQTWLEKAKENANRTDQPNWSACEWFDLIKDIEQQRAQLKRRRKKGE